MTAFHGPDVGQVCPTQRRVQSQLSFTQIPDLVEDDDRLDALDCKVLRVLAKFAWNKTACFPSNRTIARRAHTSVASVKRRLAHLVECGHLSRERVRPTPANWTGRYFRLLWRESEEYLIAGNANHPSKTTAANHPSKTTCGNSSTLTVAHHEPGRVAHCEPRIQTVSVGNGIEEKSESMGKFCATSNGNGPRQSPAAPITNPLSEPWGGFASTAPPVGPLAAVLPTLPFAPSQPERAPTRASVPPPPRPVVSSPSPPPGAAQTSRERARAEQRLRAEAIATSVLESEERTYLEAHRETEAGRRLLSRLIAGNAGNLVSVRAELANLMVASAPVEPVASLQKSESPPPLPLTLVTPDDVLQPKTLQGDGSPIPTTDAYREHMARAEAARAARSEASRKREEALEAQRGRIQAALGDPSFVFKALLLHLIGLGVGSSKSDVDWAVRGITEALDEGRSSSGFAAVVLSAVEGRVALDVPAASFLASVTARNARGQPLGRIFMGTAKRLGYVKHGKGDPRRPFS